jgi:hypothetical protein
MSRGWIATAALTAALAAPPPSQAVTVALESEPVVAVVVTASPGERNHIEMSVGHNGLTVEDSNPMVAGPGCHPNQDNSVSCPDPTASVRAVRVALGDGDDSVRAFFDDALYTFLAGGAGDDVLQSFDTSPTEFTGGPGDDEMRGGLGRDVLLEGRSPNGSDLIEGDRFSSTQPAGRHRDVVSYRERTSGVSAGLDSVFADRLEALTLGCERRLKA